jgi:hypothetical protein
MTSAETGDITGTVDKDPAAGAVKKTARDTRTQDVSTAQPGVVQRALPAIPSAARRGGHAAGAVEGCRKMNQTQGRADGEREEHARGGEQAQPSPRAPSRRASNT